MDDKSIIKLFFDRSEDAIRQLLLKYGNAMRRISLNILKNDQDAEECVNDSCLGVWNKIPPENPDPLHTYVLRITRNISLAKYRHQKADKRNASTVSLEEISDCIPEGSTVEEDIEVAELTRAIEGWLDGLNSQNLYIFMRRFWYMDSSLQVGRAIGISEAAVNLRVARLKKNLYEYLRKNGYLS